LAALIPGAPAPSAPATTTGIASRRPSDGTRTIAVEEIHPSPGQPRTRFDDARLDELAASIKTQGIIQPLIVRTRAQEDGGGYELIAGERRWRAAQRAGLTEIPALIRPVPDQVALAQALIENIQREDLNPLEEAQGLERLIAEFGLTHDAAAKAVGRSRSAVTNLLRLRELAPPVQEYLMDGRLDMGHARALLGLAAGQQVAAASRVVAQGMSVREAERLAHAMASPVKRKAKRSARAADPDLARLQDDLAGTLGAPVTIEPRKGGAGRVVIAYSSLEQLDGILARMR